MSSSYTKIYNLLRSSEANPYEDYLTEIIAPLFEQKNILSSFFKQFAGINLIDIHDIKVHTQKTYKKLLTHVTDSRPDLVITFRQGEIRKLVFVENKLSSGEGHLQLQRYQEHLQQSEKAGFSTHFFYITKYFDPKQIEKSSTPFCQLQWFQVFTWLQENYKADLYCNQILKYMEEIELNKSRTFLPQDVYSVQNLGKTISMLDQCLNGKTSHSFVRFFGKPKPWGNRAIELRDYNRYVIRNDQSDWKFVGCGFTFEDSDYPEVAVFIEVNANSEYKTVLMSAFEEFEKINEGWTFQRPEDQNDDFMLYASKSVIQFLAEKDHIEAIEKFFIDKLTELNKLKGNLPELQWIVNEQETLSADDEVAI
ncbi:MULTISPECIES: PD-(D/E)XK nuclease family protein [Planococcus]|uniref:PD-(D/E)XK nuclease family protein n=1 Tax=Planococcus faecalis TaxID=1598147 RepID=A0ABN4XMG5_9BACL|nr:MULTISPECIES: PD-(D/E)XK nuclease family protein [Planococcus]AQU80911.1 hypothetical protein AJGP001_17155 [Planococcus faecalis]MDJ0333579.1 PD-(D/E)XK nuclease family protein [Planococcus sp. S3-L1]OHX55879.1 hypothetical protein BB777_01730 [Planococcus faecalis]